MKIREVETLLAAHAEALNRQRGAAFVADLKHYRSAKTSALEPLFDVAAQAKTALRRVQPRPDFVAELKTRLIGATRPASARPSTSVWWVAGVGGALSILSLVAIGLWRGQAARRVVVPQR